MSTQHAFDQVVATNDLPTADIPAGSSFDQAVAAPGIQVAIGLPIALTPSIARLAAALANAQRQIRPAVKDAKNPHFGSKYANLAAVAEACRDALAENGIAVSQFPSADGGKVTVSTMLMHESGEYILSALTLTAVKTDPQGVGSAITYGRRYGLAAVVGVVADEDDDGNAASGRGGSSSQGRQTSSPQPAKADGPIKAQLLGIREDVSKANNEPYTYLAIECGRRAPLRHRFWSGQPGIDKILEQIGASFVADEKTVADFPTPVPCTITLDESGNYPKVTSWAKA